MADGGGFSRGNKFFSCSEGEALAQQVPVKRPGPLAEPGIYRSDPGHAGRWSNEHKAINQRNKAAPGRNTESIKMLV